VRPADVASADAARDLGTLMAAARRLLESELSAHTQAQLPVVVNSYEPDLANLKRRTCWALQLAAPGRPAGRGRLWRSWCHFAEHLHALVPLNRRRAGPLANLAQDRLARLCTWMGLGHGDGVRYE
jgi:hypothetical protein